MRRGNGRNGCSLAVFACAGGLLGCGALGAPPGHETIVLVGLTSQLHGPLDARVREASAAMEAVERLAAESPTPAARRGSLLARMRYGVECYRADLTPEELVELLRVNGARPPGLGQPRDRFYNDAFVWLGDGGQGQANTSRRANLTYSFVADGTTWGVSCASISGAGPSTLDAALTTQFGSLDRGREFMRSAIASWRRYGGLTYTEVSDDGEPQDLLTARQSTRGDIRIGGRTLGTTGSFPLAYNTFPSNMGFTGCSGGDMVINVSYFTPVYMGNSNGGFLYFRNTVAHEHGHGLGFLHSVPCDFTKLMEYQISLATILQSNDEERAVIGNYGDRFAGNHSIPAAQDFGTLTPTSGDRSVIEKDLGLNGTVVLINSQPVLQDDWFRFTITGPRLITVSVTPRGDSQLMGKQSSGCSSVDPLITTDALRAGDLNVQMVTTGGTVIVQGSANGPGLGESVAQNLGAGTYLVRVFDTGPNPADNQRVQLYDLDIDVGGALAPPRAMAGLHKRVRANTVCQFIGNHNSYPNDPLAGNTIPSGGYAWDMDGNGTFESNNNSQPTITYVSNGVYPVTLRVTDNNGLTATDTIQVTVFGASTSVTGVTPATGALGMTVPVTITGTNFKGVSNASQVSVSGTGVSVTGTPVVNPLGTQISGLSFVVSAGAAATARDVTVSNSDGQGAAGTGVARFTVQGGATGACCNAGACSVIAPGACTSGAVYQGDGTSCAPNPCPQPTGACCDGSTCSVIVQSACAGAATRFAGVGTACNAGGNNTTPCCKADFNQSGMVTVQDVFDFLTAWFSLDVRSDFNGGGVSVQDVFDYIAAWFVGCP